ncbi:MAG: DUF5678 domain-containing protein [Promethearchaeota archaeon]
MNVEAGKWVLLKEDEIIDSNDNPYVLFKKAEKMQDENVIVSKIPSSEICFY